MNSRDWFIVFTKMFALWVLLQAADELRYVVLIASRLYFAASPIVLYMTHFLLYGAIGFFLLMKTDVLANWVFPVEPRGFDVIEKPNNVEDHTPNQTNG